MLEEYRVKLNEAALETHKLIIANGRTFKKEAQEFIDLFEKWRDAVVEGQRIALKYTKSKLAFYSADDIPDTFKLPRGCEHYKLYYLNEFYNDDESFPLKEHNKKIPYKKGRHKKRNIKKRLHVYYGPPLPRNPMDTLRLREWPRLPFESDSGLYEKDPRDPEEDLLRKFFLLAVIHAFYSYGQPIIDRDTLAAQLVLEAYQHEDDYRVPDKQSLIDTALIDVRAYIESNSKSQREAGQGEEITKKSKSRVLCEIADKLCAWRESVPGDKGDRQRYVRLSSKGKEMACETLRLLRDNIELLQQCKYRYGANSECERALQTLNGILMDPDAFENIECYWGWGKEIALPGFIEELIRWADEQERTERENKQTVESPTYVKRGDRKKDGKMWEFGFEGQSKTLMYYAGFDVIAFLLDYPQKLFLLYQIKEKLTKLVWGDDYHEKRTRQEIYESIDRKSIENGINALGGISRNRD